MSTHTYVRITHPNGTLITVNSTEADGDTLANVIAVALPGKSFSIEMDGSDVNVIFTSTLSAGEIVTLDAAVASFTPENPAPVESTTSSEFIAGGESELDGDRVGIDYSPTNYVQDTSPTEVDDIRHLTSHLAGLDNDSHMHSNKPALDDITQALVDSEKITSPTGYVSGGIVTRATGLSVDIASGEGLFNLNQVVSTVSWNAVNGLALVANSLLHIIVNSSGTISAIASTPDLTAQIALAIVETSSTDVALLAQRTVDIEQQSATLQIYTQEVIGPILVNGVSATINGTNALRIDVDSGTYYVLDFRVTVPQTAPITFNYWYRDGSGGFTKASNQTVVDTDKYDDSSGTLASLSAGEFKKDLLFTAFGGDGVEYHIVYGQEVFASQILAESGNVPNAPTSLQTYAIRTSSAIIEQGATAITVLLDERPLLGQFASQATSVTDHGLLGGLSDDDHSQYTLANGSRDFTNVIIGIDPVLPQHLATKNYVDSNATTDHGALDNLGDDDHPHYSRADGTRAFTGTVGGITPVAATDLATKGYVDSNSTSDHGNLTGLGDDDHAQYSLVDGTRAFTGTVGGITPVAATDLTTKGYVDALAGGGVIWQDPVLDRDLSTPPGSPSTGDRYIVGSSATGAWAGEEDNIAEWNGSSWDLTTAVSGFAAFVIDEGIQVTHNGTEWVQFGGSQSHGALVGLGDDDHSQYSLADGTRSFTGTIGGITPVATTDLATKGYVDSNSTSDHGLLTGLGDDDHTQYSLADGARAFTGTVGGVNPVAATDLATKDYVDTNDITDHGNLAGLGDDDHAHYSRADGTRAFTGTVRGITPVAATDLATKGYVDDNSVTDHGNLLGLADDDHSIYVHKNIARTITTQHTFDPTTPGAPFTVGTNAVDQLVTGFNADKLDGNHASAFASVTHASAHSDGGADEVSVENLATSSSDVSSALRPDGTGGLAFSDIAHSDLTGIGIDDHHARDHASTHISTGADEIDADQLDIDWNPTIYTPLVTPAEVTSVDHLTAHLAGIDSTLGQFNRNRSLFFNINNSSTSVRGDYATVSIGANSNLNATLSCPIDFATLVSVQIVLIPTATATGLDIDITTQYAGLGEIINTHTGSDTTSTYDFVLGTMITMDITSLYASLSAGDMMGILIDHHAIGQTVHYVGILLNYTI